MIGGRFPEDIIVADSHGCGMGRSKKWCLPEEPTSKNLASALHHEPPFQTSPSCLSFQHSEEKIVRAVYATAASLVFPLAWVLLRFLPGLPLHFERTSVKLLLLFGRLLS